MGSKLTVAYFKRLAKKLKKERNINHTQDLEQNENIGGHSMIQSKHTPTQSSGYFFYENGKKSLTFGDLYTAENFASGASIWELDHKGNEVAL